MEQTLRHKLISFLNEVGLEPLSDRGIRVTKDERFPELYNLKYGSILSDKSDPIVCACRGAVVERMPSGKYELRAWAFDRFFNLGERGCHDLDWSRTKVMEKADGSLIKLFNYNDEWIVSTSGSVAGRSDVGSSGRSFADLFWLVFDQVGYSRDWLDPNLCYIFELCHRDNRIVVEYVEPQLPLLAVRDRSNDFEEIELETFCEASGFKGVKSFDFGSLDALMAVVDNLGANQEGFVLFDGKGRAKVKGDLYCKLHRVRGNGEPDFSELFLNDDLEEFLLHFPEYREKFGGLVDQLGSLGRFVDRFVQTHAEYSQKEFASIALEQHKAVSGAMFAIRAGKYANFAQYLESMNPKQLDRLLGLG